MFSALKKLVGSEQTPGRDKNIPAGLQSMNQALQRRFAKGVQYNSEYGRGARGSAGGTWKVGFPGGHRPGPWRLGLGRGRVAPRPGKRCGLCRAPGASPFAGRLAGAVLG